MPALVETDVAACGRYGRGVRRLLGLAIVVATAAGCGSGPSFGAPEPASEQGDDVLDLWRGFVVTGAVVFLLVAGLIAYALVRYRRRSDEVPRQHAYNIPVEVLYTVAPVLVVAVLFGLSVAAEERVTDLADRPDVVVEVVGFQWQWRFTYPDEGVELIGTPEAGPPELVLPLGQTVRFELVANDVIHSFWVPEFLEKRDLIPGVENELDITPTRLGTYTGRCAEFCGLDHWRMSFTVRVVEEAEFDEWLEDRQ